MELPEFEIFEKTFNIRFIERDIPYGQNTLKTIKILQQAWKGDNGTIRWEDVPLVEEE